MYKRQAISITRDDKQYITEDAPVLYELDNPEAEQRPPVPDSPVAPAHTPHKGTPDHMVLRTENLVKKYGKRTVVNHVSIDVTQGEIVGPVSYTHLDVYKRQVRPH